MAEAEEIPALADDIFGDHLRTNGVTVGAAGPKGRIRERLTGFPDLATEIEDLFSVNDKIVIRFVRRGTHTGLYGGIEPSGKRAAIRDFAIWRFGGGRVAEMSNIPDQCSPLKQI